MTLLLSRSKRSLRLCRGGATVACRSARRPRERRFDERVDVAAEHASRIPDLETRPMVLHERVRVEDVGADLASPVGGAELTALLRLRFFLRPHLSLKQPRAEDLHRGFLVLELRALVLARDHDAARQVRDADGRLGLVHVLPACASRAVGVDPQVLGAYLYFRLALDFGGRIDQRERRLTPPLEVEWRDAPESMRPPLGLQVAACVRTLNSQGGAPETGLIAARRFDELRLEAAPLGPAQVHAHEPLSPIGGIRASDPRRDREDGAPFVIWPGELGLEARTRDFLRELGGFVGAVGFHLGIAIGHGRGLCQGFCARAITFPSG